MRHGLAIVSLALVAGCHAPPRAPAVEQAWVRLPAIAERPGAAYLVVRGGAAPARIVAVESASAGSSELHRAMGGGAAMASMAPVDGIDVPAGGEARLAPGGYHAMLFGLDPKLRSGGTVPLTVRFASGPPIAVEAKAVGAGDAAPY